MGFIKNDLARDIYSMGLWVKAFVGILGWGIVQKKIGGGFGFHFVFSVGSGERITQATKFSQFEIVGFLIKSVWYSDIW